MNPGPHRGIRLRVHHGTVSYRRSGLRATTRSAHAGPQAQDPEVARLLAEVGFFAVLLGSVMLFVGFVAFAAGVGGPYVAD